MKTGSNNARSQSGFTLVEMVVVLAILAIITSVALPSYQNYVTRTYRTEAMTALQGLAQSMERYYVQNNNTYADAANGKVPRFFASTSPIDGGTPRYNLTIESATDTAYTLRATPIAGTSQEDDGIIELSSTGQRGWDKNDNDTIETSEQNWDK